MKRYLEDQCFTFGAQYIQSQKYKGLDTFKNSCLPQFNFNKHLDVCLQLSDSTVHLRNTKINKARLHLEAKSHRLQTPAFSLGNEKRPISIKNIFNLNQSRFKITFQQKAAGLSLKLHLRYSFQNKQRQGEKLRLILISEMNLLL